MGVRYNALGLVGNAERALIALALKYELHTGVQVKWRQSQKAIYDMVEESINGEYMELVEKAVEFLDALPGEVRHQFVIRKIEPLPHQPVKIQKYRGASVPVASSRNSRPDQSTALDKTKPKKTKIWRGTVYS